MANLSVPKSSKAPFWLIVAGLAFVVIGLLAIFHPMVTALATSIVLAATFLIAGVSSIAAALAGDRTSGRAMNLFFGVLAIAAGALLMFFPIEGAVNLVWLIGAFYAANGVIELIVAFRGNDHRAVKIALGLVDVVLGLFVLFLLPAGALQLLAVLVGVGLIFRALVLFLMARLLRKLT